MEYIQFRGPEPGPLDEVKFVQSIDVQPGYVAIHPFTVAQILAREDINYVVDIIKQTGTIEFNGEPWQMEFLKKYEEQKNASIQG